MAELTVKNERFWAMTQSEREAFESGVNLQLKADMELLKLKRPDRDLLRIDIAIRLSDFKGLDWNWASTQQSCLTEADQILALIDEKVIIPDHRNHRCSWEAQGLDPG